ncbi:MAG: DUF5011 domain-containing protein [Coriobacteriia bacterium]|nr:DUF5011 domain-containing protein [Coriobacteriia bacterium]
MSYQVTDSDHNTTLASGLVLVGDWDIIDGYAISAFGYAKSIGDVDGDEAEVLFESRAKAIDVRPTLPGNVPNPNFGLEVAVVVADDDDYYDKTPGLFNIVLAVDEARSVTKTIAVDIAAGSGPDINFTQKPLLIAQTPGVSYTMTAEDLKAYLEVTDAEDYPVWVSDSDGRTKALYTTMQVTVLDEMGVPTSINTASIGVYKVRYVATDDHNNTTTAYRAVVVTDGRYLIEPTDGDEGIIIGARDFVIKQSDVTRDESDVKTLSYAEAFDCEGNPLTVALKDGIPAGYTTATASPGSYDFVWVVLDYATEKEIIGLVVIADDVDPGNKDSQYAVYASNFYVNTTEAAAIQTASNYASKAYAQVVKLVASAPDPTLVLYGTGGFEPEPGSYEITFGILGIPASVQQAKINGVVSDGLPPVIVASTPVEIWIGPAGSRPTGAILPTQWNNMYEVTATDPDGDGKAGTPGFVSNVPKDITSDVIATAVGSAVNTAEVGQYQMHYEVTDADGNTATAERLVVVNDGRYEVGEGRILYAKPFVIRSASVATDEAARLAQVRSNTDAKLYAGSNESSSVSIGSLLPSAQVSFTSLGGYSQAVNTYNITVNGVDFPTSGPPIVRIVQAEVVDAEVLEQGPSGETENSYFIFGNNLSLNPLQADAIQNDARGVELALLEALGAGARLANASGSLSNLTVKVDAYDGFNTRPTGEQAIGSYQVVITDADSNISATLTVSVALGNPPLINATPKPLVIPISSNPGSVTLAQLMQGVTATDVEDDAAGIPLTVSIVGGTPTIATNLASVTKVTYTVTDSAGNTATVSRAVIINDGTFVWNDDYILRASSFIVKRADVSASDRPAQIKQLSNALAWTSEGTALPSSSITVNSTAGYTAAVGNYYPVLSLLESPAVLRTITAKVHEDTKTGTNGDNYAIVAGDFIINTTEANALASGAFATIERQFLALSGAASYLRLGTMGSESGTKALSTALKQGTGVAFSNLAGTMIEGDRFNVTFWVDEDKTASVTVSLLISNGTPPVLTVPPVKVVAVGASFPRGGPTDSAPSYLQGVTVSDLEDGPALTPAQVVILDHLVNTSINQSSYIVNYSVTDSDYNTTTAKGLVLVGDWVISNGYAISAYGFTKNLSAVQGTQAEVLQESKAKAIDIRPTLSNGAPNPNYGASVGVVVANDGGYYSRTSSAGTPNGFRIVLAVGEARSSTVAINARVNDNRVSITYYANGGTGTPPVTVIRTPGSSVAAASPGSLQRTGFTFVGWSFTATGGAAYIAGQNFRVYEDTRLYAVWVAIPQPQPQPQPQPPVIVVPPQPPQPPIVIVPPQQPAPPVQIMPPAPYVPPTPPPAVIVQPPAAPSVPVYPPSSPTGYTPIESERDASEASALTPVIVTGNQPAEIHEQEVPRIIGEDEGHWSLVNLISTLLMALIALMLLIRYIRHPRLDDHDDDTREADARRAAREGVRREQRNNQRINYSGLTTALFVVGMVVTAAILILLVVTQSFTHAMIMIDSYTAAFIVLLLSGVICAVALFVSVRVDANNQIEEEEYYAQARHRELVL